MGLKQNWKLINEVKDLRNYFLIIWLVVFGLNLNNSIFFLYPLSLGLNFFEMMFVLFSISRIAYLIAVVPTGMIADKISTKACIIFTILIYSIAFLLRGSLPFLILPFIAFIISETLMGIADASFIGAADKYEYSFTDRVPDTHIFSTSHSIAFFIRALATLLGGLVVYYSSMKWTYLIGAGIIFFGFLLSLRFLKEPVYKKTEKSSFELYKEGFKFAITHKKTFYLMIGLSLLGLGIFASRNVYQPLLTNLGLDTSKFAVAFGLIFTLQMLFSGLGAFLVQRIEKKIRLSLFFLLTLTLMAALIVSITFTNVLAIIIVLIWLVALAEGSQYTQSTIMINRFINNEHIRATVTSIASLTSALVLALFIPIIGKLTDNLGINANLYLSAGLIILGALILYFPHLTEEKIRIP